MVYSNCEEVALYLNGKLLAKQKPDHGPETQYGSSLNKEALFNGGNANRLQHPPFTFNLDQFQAGSLKAVGLIQERQYKNICIYSRENSRNNLGGSYQWQGI